METAKKKGFGKFLFPAVILAGKSAKLIKVVKAFKFAKIFLTAGTMLLSIFAYSFSWGWKFALGFVIMLLIHEMGHVIALKMKGMKASAPVFIPFLGALIFAPSMGSKEDEAFVGYGGPLLGTIGALALLPIWLLMPSHPPLLMTLSFVALFLNLFNLVPVRPFDGGRITQVIGGWFKYIGALAIVGLVMLFRDPGLLLLVILVLYDWEGIRRLTRSIVTISCWLLMVGLYFAGFSSGNQAAMWVDVTLSFLYSLVGVVHLIQLYQAKKKWDAVKNIPVPSLTASTVAGYYAIHNDPSYMEWTKEELWAYREVNDAYRTYQFQLNGLNKEERFEFMHRMYSTAEENSSGEKAQEKTVPPIPMKTRMKWLALYLGLAALIALMMFWEAGHLQKVINK